MRNSFSSIHPPRKRTCDGCAAEYPEVPTARSSLLKNVGIFTFLASMISSSRVGSRGVSRLTSRRLSSSFAGRSRRVPAAAGVVLRNFSLRQQRLYSTERVLELRSGKTKEEQPKILYNPKDETENCGVGLIASLKSVPSRDIVEKADEMLVRMSHRGGCGCDPASGDGSGK